MQNGDRETQSTEYVETPTEESKDPVAVEPAHNAAATESLTTAATRMLLVTVESMRQRFSRATLQSGSIWQRLREQRREAAAVVVLIVMAMIWYDSGSPVTESASVSSASNAQDAFDSFETLLSDFEPVGDDPSMRESSDPFESQSQNSPGSDLYIPRTEGSFESDTFSTRNGSADSGWSTPTTMARYPDTAPASNASAAQTSANDGFGQQQPRKVKFAGRIQPAN